MEESRLVRLLIHNLPSDTTGTKIQQVLNEQGWNVSFTNIKAPKLDQLLPLKPEKIFLQEPIEVSQQYSEYWIENALFDTLSVHLFASCFVEIITNEDTESIQHALQSVPFLDHENFCAIQIINSSELNFQHPNFCWYPDLLRNVLEYFHFPPSKMPHNFKDNSYVTWFGRFTRDCIGCFETIQDSFYCITLAMSIRGECLEFVAEKWKKDKQIVLIAMLQNPRALLYAHKSLQKDVTILNALQKQYPKLYTTFQTYLS